MQKTENAVRNIIWGLVNKIVTLFLPFLTRTLMIYYMGVQYLGLSSLFTSVLSMLSLSELGFSSAIIFSMYKPIAEKDYGTVSALLNFYRKCYDIVGIVILVLGLVLLPFLERFVSGSHPEDINLQILYLIYLFNTVIGYFLFAYKKSLLTAFQRNDIDSNITTVTVTLQYVIQSAIIVLTRNYYIYIVVLPILTITNNIVTMVIVNRRYPEIRCAGKITAEYSASIKKKIAGLVTQKIGITILNSADNLVISAFLGLTPLALYNNYYYIMSSVAAILGIFMTSVASGIGNSLVTKSKEENYKDYLKFNFMYVWIVCWCTVCLLCLYQPFMLLWVKAENMLPSYIAVMLAIYFFANKNNDFCGAYKQAAGIWWEGRFMPIVAASVNLSINIILVQYIGLAGIIISTIISLLFIYFPWGTQILYKHYFKGVGKGTLGHLWMQIRYAITCIVMCTVTYVLCNLLPIAGFGGLFIKFGICIIIPNVIFALIYMRSEEFKASKQFVFGYIDRVMKRRN